VAEPIYKVSRQRREVRVENISGEGEKLEFILRDALQARLYAAAGDAEAAGS